jgi:hypothetical protein
METLKNKIKTKLEEYEKKNDYFKEKKKRFQDILNDLEREAKELERKDKRKTDNGSFKKEKVKAVDEVEISRKEQIEIKQRVASYSMKAFDILDLKKIIKHWKGIFLTSFLDNTSIFKAEKAKILENNKKHVLNCGPDKNKKGKQGDEKKTNVESVKYEYRVVGDDLKKIIPFCNNHFIIQERD